eukprot:gnl/Chilomastix_caulleri/2610.p2 GENE.gnl/Chilomastix_caulleri/2610~~gnl/Chilomastix_caulleri/2610.p2  ORF type:complete len:65 (-),score=8.27 gnl/Chilomastix_caulleri/2610:325-519(-)
MMILLFSVIYSFIDDEVDHSWINVIIAQSLLSSMEFGQEMLDVKILALFPCLSLAVKYYFGFKS